jgi:hypothetical protein
MCLFEDSHARSGIDVSTCLQTKRDSLRPSRRGCRRMIGKGGRGPMGRRDLDDAPLEGSKNPRAETSAEHRDGLWTTGRPDDPRRSGQVDAGAAHSPPSVPHSPGPRPQALWQRGFGWDSSISPRDVPGQGDAGSQRVVGVAGRHPCLVDARRSRSQPAPTGSARAPDGVEESELTVAGAASPRIPYSVLGSRRWR